MAHFFDYIRNQALNANDFFSNKSGVAKPMFIQNIYGGTFGGPIKRSKLSSSATIRDAARTRPSRAIRTVPTDLAKTGIFQYTVGGATQQYNMLNADPLHKGIDPTIATLLKNYPVAQQQRRGRRLELRRIPLQQSQQQPGRPVHD